MSFRHYFYNPETSGILNRKRGNKIHHSHLSVVMSVVANVARWYIFTPKISIWVNFGKSCNGTCWYFYANLFYFKAIMVHFMAIRYILWSFSNFSPVLVCCTENNLATLVVATILVTRILRVHLNQLSVIVSFPEGIILSSRWKTEQGRSFGRIRRNLKFGWIRHKV
jgi:hypothetical protein